LAQLLPTGQALIEFPSTHWLFFSKLDLCAKNSQVRIAVAHPELSLLLAQFIDHWAMSQWRKRKKGIGRPKPVSQGLEDPTAPLNHLTVLPHCQQNARIKSTSARYRAIDTYQEAERSKSCSVVNSTASVLLEKW
jgi:hypothetical protein